LHRLVRAGSAQANQEIEEDIGREYNTHNTYKFVETDTPLHAAEDWNHIEED
jgi:hypothetical protein